MEVYHAIKWKADSYDFQNEKKSLFYFYFKVSMCKLYEG